MKTPTLDFETLTLKDALDVAVLMEEEARDRYVELAGQLRMHQTPEAATFFEKMAGTEELHRAGLLAHRQLLFEFAERQLCAAQDHREEVVEVVRHSAGQPASRFHFWGRRSCSSVIIVRPISCALDCWPCLATVSLT